MYKKRQALTKDMSMQEAKTQPGRPLRVLLLKLKMENLDLHLVVVLLLQTLLLHYLNQAMK